MILYMIKKFDEFINENIFDGIGRRSKGGVVRKENYVEYVDLGLPSGTLWATCNLGASSPEEYGDYYAWGETETKDYYDWDTYKFGEEFNLTKYNYEDGKTILDPEDDAAHVVLGGEWHMPTKKQIEELFENTTNEKSRLNWVEGILFTSKINNKKLFFPYSGFKNKFSIDRRGYNVYYWSSSIDENSYTSVDSIIIHSFRFNDHILDKENRCYGLCVRGVLGGK